LKQFDRATRLKLSKKRRRHRQRADRRRSRECNNRATRCDACGLRAFVSDSTSHFMKIRSSVLLCWWRQFEEFIAALAAWARWKVLGGCSVIALTGLGLLLLPAEGQPSATWRVCVASKTVLFIIAVGLFCFTSWVLWPARVLASAEEIPNFQRRFRIIAIALVALVGASIVLGVVGSHS